MIAKEKQEDILKRFKEHLGYLNYSVHTISLYSKYSKDFLFWSPVDLENLTPIHITEYANTLSQYAPRTKNLIIKGILPSLFKYVLSLNLIKENIFSYMKIPKVKEEKTKLDILTVEEMKKVVDNPSGNAHCLFRNKILLKILIMTGGRISEILNLTIKDVVGNEILFRGKGKKERKISISDSTKKLLDEYIKTYGIEDKLFDLTRQRAFIIIQDTIKLNNIDKSITPHSFRHSFATLWAKNGGNESALRKQMGWNRTFDCSIYVDLANQDCSEQYNKIIKELE